MSSSAPLIKPPMTLPARFAWLQSRLQTHVRPYHLAVGAAVGLITTVFVGLIAVLILIATNFNVLGWME